MPREQKEHCAHCGVKKTEENTYIHRTKSGKVYFQYICKECSKKVSASRYLKTLPFDRQQGLIEKKNAKYFRTK